MSEAIVVTLKNELVAKLRTLTRPTYNFDLSDHLDRVKAGDGGVTVAEPPCVILGGLSIIPVYGGGATLSEYETAFGLEWWAYAPAISEYSDDRLDAAAFLGTDVVRAVHRAHQELTYPNLRSCTKVLCVMLNTFGDGMDVPPGCGVAYGTITIITNTQDGA